MLPWDRPLTNIDIDNIVRAFPMAKIFRGTFSRDELAALKPRRGVEAGIINLSKSYEDGTHWTLWFKYSEDFVTYYDSYGLLEPPIEFIEYLSHCEIWYNISREQTFNSVICGQLCLCHLLMQYENV